MTLCTTICRPWGCGSQGRTPAKLRRAAARHEQAAKRAPQPRRARSSRSAGFMAMMRRSPPRRRCCSTPWSTWQLKQEPQSRALSARQVHRRLHRRDLVGSRGQLISFRPKRVLAWRTNETLVQLLRQQLGDAHVMCGLAKADNLGQANVAGVVRYMCLHALVRQFESAGREQNQHSVRCPRCLNVQHSRMRRCLELAQQLAGLSKECWIPKQYQWFIRRPECQSCDSAASLGRAHTLFRYSYAVTMLEPLEGHQKSGASAVAPVLVLSRLPAMSCRTSVLGVTSASAAIHSPQHAGQYARADAPPQTPHAV